MKAFSDHRRKLKPNRRHVASSNPVKVLQKRENIVAAEYDADNVNDNDFEETKRKSLNGGESNGDSLNGEYDDTDVFDDKVS